MPTFMQNLAANPSGSSGIYQSSSGANPYQEDAEALGLYNRVKDREMDDFMRKANFMSDLSLKQDRMKRIYDSADTTQQGQMNTVMHDPNAMTAYERGELGVRQQGVEAQKARLAQQGKLGQEAIDVKTAQEKLNQQKSDQINANKLAEHERKTNESSERVRVAEERIKQSGDNFNARLEALKEYQKAVEERHKLEMDKREHQYNTTNEQHERQIKALEEQVKQRGRTKTTTEVNPEGTERTTTTERGSAAEDVTVTGPKNKSNPTGKYTIPKDKVDDWNKNHKDKPDQIDEGGEGAPQGDETEE